MDSRNLHIAFQRAVTSVAWDRHGENEYVSVCRDGPVEIELLQALIDRTFVQDELVISLGRHDHLVVPRSRAAQAVAERVPSHTAATISDEELSVFLQVLAVGVARTGRAQANYSLKRTNQSLRD